MTTDSQPRYFAPGTHQLTLGELRRMLETVSKLSDDFVVRSRSSAPFEVFEAIQALHGVEVFHTTKTINLPID